MRTGIASRVSHMPALSGVYRIASTVTGDCYIGGTCNIRSRIASQLSALARGMCKSARMQASYDEHGVGAFRFEVLELCDLAAVPDRETYWLRTFPRATFNTHRFSSSVKGSGRWPVLR